MRKNKEQMIEEIEKQKFNNKVQHDEMYEQISKTQEELQRQKQK